VSAFGRRPLSAFAEFSRRVCSECGSRDIRWSSARDLVWEVDFGDRLRVFHFVGLYGGDADAWFCPVCTAWGVFGPME
jgi:hypothetical protein